MKEKQLKELFETNTNEGEVDYSKISESINGEFNSLLDKKMPDMDSEKSKWEEAYSQDFFGGLGMDSIKDKETLAGFIDDRKDLDLTKIGNDSTTIERLTKELTIHKADFKGDDFDLDTLMNRTTRMMAEDSKLDFDKALDKIKESKPELFTAKDFKKANIKNVKPGSTGNESAFMEAFNKMRR